MSSQWEQLGSEDAIELQENFSQNFITIPMFKSGKLSQLVLNKCLDMSTTDWDSDHPSYLLRKKWVEGLEAEVLKVSSHGWKKGKIRVHVTVEFIPDEPESPLDNIRKSLTFNE